MDIIAVSQAEPRWLDIRGPRVQTSIIHRPLTDAQDSILVRTSSGIDGNRPAVHNGQVYGFFAHHYDYWCQKLDVDRQAWGWCHWGENLTFNGPELDETNFYLGDTWAIGKDVVLQVCGSRVPCYKLAWRCGQKDSWLKELAASGKCGVYFKAIQGGHIHPGDRVKILARRSHGPRINCATITRVAFADAVTTRSTMDLLNNDPDLLDMNKFVFWRKLSMLHDQELVGRNRWRGWRQVCVSKVVAETPDIKSFYLCPIFASKQNEALESLKGLASFLPGQHVVVRLPNGIIRPWSLSSYPCEIERSSPEQYRISIKHQGKASKWMHDHCTEGTLLDIRSPTGSFTLDWSPQFPGRQIYVSAGIGVTPMLAMLQAHLQHQAMRAAPAVWVQVARDYRSLPFILELAAMLSRPEAQELNIPIMLFLTGAGVGDCTAAQSSFASRCGRNTNVKVYPGRPTIEHYKDLISKPYFMDPLRITPIGLEGRLSTAYICGPPAFELTTRGILQNLGVPEAMVLSESFSSGSRTTNGTGVKRAQVQFIRSKRSLLWKSGDQEEGADEGERVDVNPGVSLLELAEEIGMTPEFGCRTGVCGSCEVALRCGKVSGGLQPDGRVRICIARPASDEVTLEL